MTNLVLASVVAILAIGPLIMCLRQPMQVALPAYAALIPFGGLIAVGNSKFTSLSSLLGIVLAGGLALQLVRGRRLEVPLSITVPLWLLLLGTAGASVLWSLNPGKTAAGFLGFASLILIYVLVAINYVDRQILSRTESALLLGGIVATGYGLTQLFLLGGFPQGGSADADGRFGDDMLGPNNEAVALLLPLLVALGRAVVCTETSKRIFYTCLAAVLLVGILMTGSRGGALAAVVAVVTMALANHRTRGRLFAYIGAGVAVIALVFLFHPGGIAQRVVAIDSSSGRSDVWRIGLAACPDYCALGSGWGTFPDVYAATQPSVPGAAVVGANGAYEPHNILLLVGIELGLAGLLLLAAGFLATVAEAVRLPAALRGPPLAGVLGTWFAAMFLSNLEFKFFWMALMMVALTRNLSKLEGSTRQTREEAVSQVRGHRPPRGGVMARP